VIILLSCWHSGYARELPFIDLIYRASLSRGEGLDQLPGPFVQRVSSKPDDDLTCPPVNIPLGRHLVGLFGVVALANADAVNPEDPGCVFVPQPFQSNKQIRADAPLVPVDHDGHGARA